MKCSIYEDRPDVCKRFPTQERLKSHLKSCSYTFAGLNERFGECNRCGECCILYADIHKLGDSFVPGNPCPYLIQS